MATETDPEKSGMFTQEDVDRIVGERLGREKSASRQALEAQRAAIFEELGLSESELKELVTKSSSELDNAKKSMFVLEKRAKKAEDELAAVTKRLNDVTVRDAIYRAAAESSEKQKEIIFKMAYGDAKIDNDSVLVGGKTVEEYVASVYNDSPFLKEPKTKTMSPTVTGGHGATGGSDKKENKKTIPYETGARDRKNRILAAVEENN